MCSLLFLASAGAFGPSCDAKRSAIITASAMDLLLPAASYRQWVLVIPKRLRYYINTRPDLAGYLSKLLAREISRFVTRNCAGTPAQVHFLQRFGGALNLHIHIHAVVSDGVFKLRHGLPAGRLEFTPVQGPNEAELDKIATAVRRKLLRRLCRIGCLAREAAEGMLAWEHSGFSLHKDVVISPRNRAGLERLLGYCSRPALSLARLAYDRKMKTVAYRAEGREGKDGTITMEPVEFLRRWGLLMPPPHKNLVHYYGALAPRSPLRPALTARAAKETGQLLRKEKIEKLKARGRSWAACLARVFEVFPLVCPTCRIQLKPVAVIFEDRELLRLLNHFGPPDEDCQLDPRVDEYDMIDPPAPED